MNAPHQPAVRYRSTTASQPDLPRPHRPILHLNPNVAARTPLNAVSSAASIARRSRLPY